jgi:pimeloyl-ACP methyl ester carboxylesterase
MSTFVLIHGAGDVGWSWHLVERELRALGHDTVAPDLPCDDDRAGLSEYADTVIKAIGDRTRLVVVGHSYGGFTAPLIAARLPIDLLVLVAGMVPSRGEAANDYLKNTGYDAAIRKQAAHDGVSGHKDPYVLFYHDVPRKLAEEARRHERPQSATPGAAPWPLKAWPKVPTRFILCTEDRLFPADYLRRVVAKRLRIVPDEIVSGHCVTLSHPKELAAMLNGYVGRPHRKTAARGTRTKGVHLESGRGSRRERRRAQFPTHRHVDSGGNRPDGAGRVHHRHAETISTDARRANVAEAVEQLGIFPLLGLDRRF